MTGGESIHDDTFVGARFSAFENWIRGMSPKWILDLGGRASTAAALRMRFPNGRIVVGNIESVPVGDGWSVLRMNGESIPLRSGSVDLIFCSEVLEHVQHPDVFLAEMARVLRPAGDLLLTTPNFAAWHNRLLVPLGFPPANYTAYPYRRVGSPAFIQRLDADVQDHPRVFTRAGLLEALGLHSFTIRADSAISYAVHGRPLYRLRRVIDAFLPGTWKEDLIVWAQASPDGDRSSSRGNDVH